MNDISQCIAADQLFQYHYDLAMTKSLLLTVTKSLSIKFTFQTSTSIIIHNITQRTKKSASVFTHHKGET